MKSVLLLIGFVLASIHFADAQQPTRVPRIGFLAATSPSAISDRLKAFRQGLRELGHVEGKTILFEYRFAEGKFDRLPELAAELVRLNIDVIVVSGGRPTAAAKNATATIPIIAILELDRFSLINRDLRTFRQQDRKRLLTVQE